MDRFNVVKTFTESVSGYTRSADEGPELQNAIQFAKDNQVEVILVHEISRLGRRTSEVLTLLEDLKASGIMVYVKSLDMLINDSGPAEAMNKFLVTLMTDLARMESETMSYRIKSGLEERLERGIQSAENMAQSNQQINFFQSTRK